MCSIPQALANKKSFILSQVLHCFHLTGTLYSSAFFLLCIDTREGNCFHKYRKRFLDYACMFSISFIEMRVFCYFVSINFPQTYMFSPYKDYVLYFRDVIFKFLSNVNNFNTKINKTKRKRNRSLTRKRILKKCVSF